MQSLIRFAARVETVPHSVSGASAIPIHQLHLASQPAIPDRLPPGLRPSTYTSKPLVRVGKEPGDSLASQVRAAVSALGYTPTVAWTRDRHGGRIVKLRTPETIAQMDRGRHRAYAPPMHN